MTKQTRLMRSGSALRAVVTFGALGTLLAGAGCGRGTDRGDETERRAARSPPRSYGSSGFETPTADWTSPTGVLGQSTTRSQGSFSVSVRNNGWTEVVSRPLSSLGPVGPMINYDIRLPQTVTWGETRMIVRLPSKSVVVAGAGQHAAHRHARGGLPADHVRDPARADGGDEQHLQRSRIPHRHQRAGVHEPVLPARQHDAGARDPDAADRQRARVLGHDAGRDRPGRHVHVDDRPPADRRSGRARHVEQAREPRELRQRRLRARRPRLRARERLQRRGADVAALAVDGARVRPRSGPDPDAAARHRARAASSRTRRRRRR